LAGLSSDKEHLVKLNKKWKGFLAHPKTDIKLKPDFIKEFIRETMRFFIWVFKELHQAQKTTWKISRAVDIESLEKILAKVND
jgi:hypothetical protein